MIVSVPADVPATHLLDAGQVLLHYSGDYENTLVLKCPHFVAHNGNVFTLKRLFEDFFFFLIN